MPLVRLQIKVEDVVVGLARVVETAVSTIDEHLVLVQGGTHVGTGAGCIDRRVLVGSHIVIALDTLPEDLVAVGAGHLHEPAIVQTNGGAGVTTEDEDLFLGGHHCGVLGTWHWVLLTLWLLLLPMAVPC